MKKRGIIFTVISAASLIISLFSLYLAIIILGSADGFFIFSALTAVLGILGLISSLGKGKAAFACHITATVVSVGFTLITLVCSIAYGDIFVIALIYFCLYTAGAAFAFPHKKQSLTSKFHR